MELARDLASLARMAGVLIIGVDEDDLGRECASSDGHRYVLSPIQYEQADHSTADQAGGHLTIPVRPTGGNLRLLPKEASSWHNHEPNPQRRILINVRLVLETPVWSYIGDHHLRADLELLATRRNLAVCTPPSVLLEVLRTPNPQVRARIVDALRSPQWVRLHTEADTQCSEIAAAIARNRPQWMLQEGSQRKDYVAGLRDFWLRRIWRQAATHTAKLADHRRNETLRDIEIVSTAHKANAEMFKRDGFQFEVPGDIYITFEAGQQLVGWRGNRVEFWRADTALTLWENLRAQYSMPRRSPLHNRAYVDWLEEKVDIGKVLQDHDGFNTLWLYDIDPAEVPRTWLQRSLPLAQYDRRIDPNSSVDWQHGMYVYDCDVFVTTDKRLHYALSKLLEQSPTKPAQVMLLRLGRNSSNVITNLDRLLP